MLVQTSELDYFPASQADAAKLKENIRELKEELQKLTSQSQEDFPIPRIELLHSQGRSRSRDFSTGNSVDDAKLESKFRELTEEWKKDTKFLSSISQIAMHPAYQRIIGMGSEVLPLILRRLSRKPDHWFWALEAITGENPVPESSQGRLGEMAEAWLDWARSHGYVV